MLQPDMDREGGSQDAAYSTPHSSQVSSDPLLPSWSCISAARMYARLAPPPIRVGLGSPPPLPHMNSLLTNETAPSTAIWPPEAWKQASDTDNSHNTTASDASHEMEVEGEYLLNHQEAMGKRLQTPKYWWVRGRGKMDRKTKASEAEGYPHYVSSYRNTSPSSSGSSSPADVFYDDEARTRVETPHIERISRYLREVDRRAILLRIEGGEKQAVLAKEYQVSRAAICNLNKHRDEVLARKDGNPLAKHPRKPRPKTLKSTIAGMPSSMKWGSSKNRYIHVLGSTSGGSLERNRTGIFELKSCAAALLLTTLRNKLTTPVELLRASERLVRLLMEEALALPPIRKIGIVLDDQHRESGFQSEHPPCAVSIEKDEGRPMLELFRTIEPEQPTGYVHFGLESKLHRALSSDSGTTDASVEEISPRLVGSHLPTSLDYHNVVLLADVSTSGRRLCAAIRCLLERGASPVMMFIVSLMATAEAVELVRSQYPDVTLVTAHIVSDEEGGHDNNVAQQLAR